MTDICDDDDDYKHSEGSPSVIGSVPNGSKKESGEESVAFHEGTAGSVREEANTLPACVDGVRKNHDLENNAPRETTSTKDAGAKRREEEEETERLMMSLQEDETADANPDDDDDAAPIPEGHRDDFNDVQRDVRADPFLLPPAVARQSVTRQMRVHYTSISLLSAAALVHYTLRTRDAQIYLALTYLTSSKLSYIILGNAILALFCLAFNVITRVFLNGLRSVEMEAVGERIRWNVTETCIALTMFRNEVDVRMAGMFLLLVLGKCLHWSLDIRGSHLRMTEEVFFFLDYDDNDHWIFSSFFPSALKIKCFTFFYKTIPRIRYTHIKFNALLYILLAADVFAISYCAMHIHKHGPSAHILFGFEAAILTVSALSIVGAYWIHVVDGVVTIFQHSFLEEDLEERGYDESHPNENDMSITDNGDRENAGQPHSIAPSSVTTTTPIKKMTQRLTISWRDHKATLTFTMELLTQAAKFFFYLLFFAVVFTYYGMPVNIFREVYISYQNLRRRLSAFASYRRLTHNMNERFESVDSLEELETVGRTCIICRDGMHVHSGGVCKKLPVCGHVFHKHCLREWLVQQQTCPTCRGDIVANEALAKAEKRRRREEERKTALVAVEKEQLDAAVLSAEDRTTAKKAEETYDAKGLTLLKMPKNTSNKETSAFVFPCLYRVVMPRGANVVDFFLANDGGKVSTTKRTVRNVPRGKMIVCTEMKWWSWDDEEEIDILCNKKNKRNIRPSPLLLNENSGADMLLKMPDGWVSCTDVERIPAAVLSSATKLGREGMTSDNASPT